MKLTTILKLLTLLIFVSSSSYVFCQNEEFRFNHGKNLGEKQIIYFKIANLTDDKSEQDAILNILINDENIFDGNIYSQDGISTICQLEINNKVTVSYLRNVLQTTGYDLDLLSVTAVSPSRPSGIYQSDSYSFFSSFNGYKDYNANNKTATADEHYAKNKDEFIKTNPELYEQAKKDKGQTVVVKRKDLESFKEEKRQHILSHPEIFIIEE